MIIDKILDRKDGEEYDAREFYYYLMQPGGGIHEKNISEAMDYGNESDVKLELLIYCNDNGYTDPEIIDFIKSINWLN